MKRKARKLLSLLLAAVMVCGLMSTAWADDEEDGHDVSPAWTCDSDNHWHVCSTEGCEQNGKHDFDEHTYPSSYEYTDITKSKHTRSACTVCDYTITENHDYKDGVCACGAVDTITLTPSPSTSKTVSLSKYSNSYKEYYAEFSVSAKPENDDLTYEWYLESNPRKTLSDKDTCTVYASDLSGSSDTLVCTAYLDSKEVDSVSWDVAYSSDISIGVTVYDTSSGYSLGSAPDEGSSSVVDQITAWLNKTGGNNEYFSFVTFTSGNFTSSSRYNGYLEANSKTNYNEEDLSALTFVPTATLSRSTDTVTESYEFTLTTENNRGARVGTYYGTLTFTIKEGASSSSGIVFSAGIGETLDLDSGRFQEFWTQNFSNGSLSYVEFTSISGGSLYTGYNGSRGTSVVSSANPTACYVKPNSRQTALDGLTVVPSSSARATTVTIRFTAWGSSRANGSATSSRSGTVTILYMNSSASITYEAGANGAVSLNPDDFTSAYRTAVGGTAPSGMTIRFTSLPTGGTLSYQSSSNRSVTLTASNMGSYDFTTRTSGSTRISDVTYTAGKNSTADTAEFVCYSGGTARFAGTITFTSKPAVVENLKVQFSCTSTGDTPISAMSFYSASAAVSGSSYIVLGAPTSGSLCLNGSPLSSSTRLSFTNAGGYPLFSNVTYRPAENTPNGTVTFPFTAYNANNQLVASGTASITVNLPVTPVTPSNPTTPTTPTTPILPVVNNVQLKDVPAGSWYATYVNTLVGAGVIGGYNDGTFRPANDVTYGEALALVMRAVGYNIQQGTGSNWAMPYWREALAEGLLPTNAAYGLNDPVNRYTIAEITARAMGLTPETGAASSPFSDTSDPYVLALHSAGIIGGTGSGFEGSKTLSRAEISAIIYRIYDTRAQSSQPAQPEQPSDTGSGDDSGTREPDRDAPWGY